MNEHAALESGGELARAFHDRGCRVFADAVAWAADLPYGRTSDRADYRLVLSEERGTCSTKHAVIAALGLELGLAVQLYIGMYEMTEANTPGVGGVLAAHGLATLPEAHTFLRCGGRRLDITRPGVRATEAVTGYLDEVAIEPHHIGPFKVDYHRAYMGRWLVYHPEIDMTLAQLWAVREACIAALGSHG